MGECTRDGWSDVYVKLNTGSTSLVPSFAGNIQPNQVYVDKPYGEPIAMITGKTPNHQANTEFAFVKDKRIWKMNYKKDILEDVRLVAVNEAGGTMRQTISYKTMESNSGLGTANDTYHSTNSENYPLTELIKVPTMKVVDKLTVTGAGKTKYQLFKYAGFTTHSSGLGVLGFKKVARSSWFPEYAKANPIALWSTNTHGSNPTNIVFQNDGNLVIYSNNNVLWSSNTYNRNATSLDVQNDGNLVIYSGNMPLWASNTNVLTSQNTGIIRIPLGTNFEKGKKYYSASQNCYLIWQFDGNLVLYEETSPQVWSCVETDPRQFGSVVKEWSYIGSDHVFFATPPTLTSTARTGDLSVTTYEYTSSTLPNKVRVLVPKKMEKKDFQTNTFQRTEQFYDALWNTERTLFTNNEGTKETTRKFFNNLTGIGKNYAVGRITQVNEKSIAYGDAYTTEEIFSYTDANNPNLVKESKKKGHNTDYITENYIYDAFGNLTDKSITVPTTATGYAGGTRSIKDIYDANGRFVDKKIDHEGYETSFEYNRLGQVTKTTNPLNVVSVTAYDSWGKLTSTTVTGASTSAQITNIVYTRTAGGGYYVTSSDPNTGEVSREFKDVFGNTIKSTTKGFALNTWISKSTEYDYLGRKVRESEPYFDTAGTSPPLGGGVGGGGGLQMEHHKIR